jgi:hypothetical protein
LKTIDLPKTLNYASRPDVARKQLRNIMNNSLSQILSGAAILAFTSAAIVPAGAQQTPKTQIAESRFAPFPAPMGDPFYRGKNNSRQSDDKDSYTVVDALGRSVTIRGPKSAAGLIANQGIYGGNLYGNTTITTGVYPPYPYGYYGYPQPYPYVQPGYIAPIAPPLNGYDRPPTVSVFPSYGYSYGYPAGGYPYPVPVPVYPHGGYGYGYGYGHPIYPGSYSSTTRTSGYGIGVGNGGVTFRLGDTKTKTRTTTEVYGP